MSGEALGGGVMVAIAAVLWVAYLMPTWARRRQYLATERNAVRLQQTMRILAETAEVPGEVRLEASARTVSAQQKVLAQAESDARADAKQAADAARAARRAAVLAARASLQPAPSSAGSSPMSTLHKLRRARSLASVVLLLGFITIAAGIVPALAGSWVLLLAGVVTAGASFGLLSKLAKAGRSIRAAGQVAGVRPSQALQDLALPRFEPVQLVTETKAAPATWTPRSLPRPMYLSRGSIAQTAMASVDAAAQLKAAAAEAEIALRAAQIASEATPITRPTVAQPAASAPAARPTERESASNSRFASMGIIGETAPGMTDLDAVLRRRRAG